MEQKYSKYDTSMDCRKEFRVFVGNFLRRTRFRNPYIDCPQGIFCLLLSTGSFRRREILVMFNFILVSSKKKFLSGSGTFKPTIFSRDSRRFRPTIFFRDSRRFKPTIFSRASGRFRPTIFFSIRFSLGDPFSISGIESLKLIKSNIEKEPIATVNPRKKMNR